MLTLSRKSLLALEAVIDIAIYARPDPIQMRDITHRLNVSQRYLEHIMQALVRADILCGTRGPRGGYRLARERRHITIADIVAVITTLNHQTEEPAPSSQLGKQIMTPLCQRIQISVEEQMRHVTLADLCANINPIQNDNSQHNDDTTHDFII